MSKVAMWIYVKIVFILDEFHDKLLGPAKCLSGLNGKNDWKYRISSGLFGTLDKTVTQIIHEGIDEFKT